MKISTKSASLLATIVALSAVGGQSVLAAEEVKSSLDSTGTVTVTTADDTGNDETKKDVVDPEKEGEFKPKDEDITNNTVKGPLKIEKVSNYNFNSIKPAAKDIVVYANPVAAATGTETRGAMVQFADVRGDEHGYKLSVKMSQQFKGASTAAPVLEGATISFNNGIMRAEAGNENVAPSSFTSSGITVGEDGQEVVVATADGSKKEGKGRYVIEFGQSPDYVAPSTPLAGGTGVADTAKESVKLFIPNKTASNMAQDTYTAKITWALSVTK